MRNMSFSMTTEQILNGSKGVTRRLAWLKLVGKTGISLQAIKQGMGLKKGEHPEKLRVIRTISSRMEPLNLMIDDWLYGEREVIREGFPEMSPAEFVEMFCRHNKCRADRIINRIEFEYVEG